MHAPEPRGVHAPGALTRRGRQSRRNFAPDSTDYRPRTDPTRDTKAAFTMQEGRALPLPALEPLEFAPPLQAVVE